MKYLNYGILFLFLIFICTWIFNHISASGGIGLALIIAYFVVWKSTKSTKGESNEKN